MTKAEVKRIAREEGNHGHIPQRNGDTEITKYQTQTASGFGRMFFAVWVEKFINLRYNRGKDKSEYARGRQWI